MSYMLHDDYKENDSCSTDSLDSFEKVPTPQGVNCLRTINTTEILEYLTPKDEPNTRKYPAISISRCPKDLSLECLPGLYNIISCNFRETETQKEGRVFFACPNSREKFLAGWENKFSSFFPNVKIQTLENFGKLTWQLPIKRFTFPDKFPYPLFHRLACCFGDLPDNVDIKNMDITFIQKDSWLFERHGPHFLCVGNKEKQKEIERKILEDSVAATVERPCMGSCVAIKSEKYPAARGVIYSRRLNFANIYLVDFGISEEFPDSCLASISSEIMEIPFLAVPCKLATFEPIEPLQVKEIFEKAKSETNNIQIKKVWYRGFFNVVDAFKDDSNQSCLVEMLKGTKPKKPTTFQVYGKEDILAYKSEKRAKAFYNALDQLTYIESQALYKSSRKQK
jgi:hypothetical protein